MNNLSAGAFGDNLFLWGLWDLGIAVLALGLYPKPFTDVMHQSVLDLLAHVARSKI